MTKRKIFRFKNKTSADRGSWNRRRAVIMIGVTIVSATDRPTDRPLSVHWLSDAYCIQSRKAL